MNAKFVINDGQHRRAAIESALHENPELGDETISVVFFVDVGLVRTQQMFADLNRYAVRPTTSLSLLYDHRDDDALVAKVRRATRADLHRPHGVGKEQHFQSIVESVHAERDLQCHACLALGKRTPIGG